jgi:hypothetical protein
VELSKKIMSHAWGRLYGLGAPLHHAAAELNKIDMSFVEWERLRAAACASAGAAEAAWAKNHWGKRKEVSFPKR